MNDHTNTIIIGAGVIGLAIGKYLCEAGRNVLILEKEPNYGMGISSRNSEVIHAGLYFKPKLLKSSFCVHGKELLYNYAAKRHIPHKRCGKLLVANSILELAKLKQIKLNAEKCGVHDLKLLTEKECHGYEPDISAIAGILSPSSGVIDTHAYMVSLAGDVENNGGNIVCNTNITAIEKTTSGFNVTTNNEYTLSCDTLINAAGLSAIRIAQMINVLDQKHIPELIMAKGSYFSYSGKSNFKHLVYPLPFQGGLGIHLTLDMAGGVKFGPNVDFIDQEEYNVKAELVDSFIPSIKHYYPGLDETKLHADYAGIRPKLSKDGLDFNIQFSNTHGINGLINLFGMESPGLTSSLAIAEYIKENISRP